MAGEKFDSKSFNPQAFGAYTERIPNLKRNELIKSKALKGNQDIKRTFNSQTGTVYAVLPMHGLIGGTAQNYDGETDLESEGTETFERGVVVIGRMKGWTERDFSEDVTGGVSFMDNVAAQVSDYKADLDQLTLTKILTGIFAMTGKDDKVFVDEHTTDITGVTATDTAGMDSESRNLSKTMKKICANLVKTAKKQLKIKSPSRVFKRIGVYNIQGAEKGHEAEAPRLYRQVENVSETLAERFAKANLKVSLPDIAGRTQAALSRQVSKVSASIQPQLTAALAGDAGQTIYNGPEKIELVTNLDGREIARTSVPYIDAYLGNMAARKARGGV